MMIVAPARFTPPNAVLDSDGNPILDASGQPLLGEP